MTRPLHDTQPVPHIPLWMGCVLTLAVAATYANSLHGPFIFDDHNAVVNNQSIRPPWSWQVLRPPTNTPVAGRPLLNTTFALNYAIGELDVRGYHVFNVAVHAMCALLLMAVVRRTLMRDVWPDAIRSYAAGLAFISALLWSVHPLQSEVVNYITQRSESLASMWYLLTLYAAIRADESPYRGRWSALAVTACVLGILSKEIVATVPLMVVLYDMAFMTGRWTQVLRRRWKLYAALAATWTIAAVMIWQSPRDGSVGVDLGVSPWQYALNQCVMIVTYLRLVIWPLPLALDYGTPRTLTIAQVWPHAVAVIALMCATAVVWFRNHRRVAFVGVWMLLLLAPSSSVLPIVTEVGAEKRMYLPSAAAVVAIVLSGHRLWRSVLKIRAHGFAPHAVTIAAAFALAATTFARNREYRSVVSIWQSAVQATPGNPRAHVNLGNACHDEGRYDEAIRHFERAIALDPKQATAFYNMGNAYRARGDLTQAERVYRDALRLDPVHVEAHLNLGDVLSQMGRHDEAARMLQQAITLRPTHADAYSNLGRVYFAMGRVDDAIASFERALQIDANNASAHNNLGTVLSHLGRWDAAVRHLREALRLNPSSRAAQLNLASALHAQGKSDEAISVYEQLLRSRPEDFDAHIGLGETYQQTGRVDDAIDSFSRAAAIAQSRGRDDVAASIRKMIEQLRAGYPAPR